MPYLQGRPARILVGHLVAARVILLRDVRLWSVEKDCGCSLLQLWISNSVSSVRVEQMERRVASSLRIYARLR